VTPARFAVSVGNALRINRLLPIFGWGSPGVGKTAVVRQAAEKQQLPFELDDFGPVAGLPERCFCGLPPATVPAQHLGVGGRLQHVASSAWWITVLRPDRSTLLRTAGEAESARRSVQAISLAPFALRGNTRTHRPHPTRTPSSGSGAARPTNVQGGSWPWT
jgi:hypothetical protein